LKCGRITTNSWTKSIDDARLAIGRKIEIHKAQIAQAETPDIVKDNEELLATCQALILAFPQLHHGGSLAQVSELIERLKEFAAIPRHRIPNGRDLTEDIGALRLVHASLSDLLPRLLPGSFWWIYALLTFLSIVGIVLPLVGLVWLISLQSGPALVG